ncbi:hypothetical protein BFP97_03390 [Roseivirga sp. 4D4]|uniref:hypothetical protein n=1 Tax=Roseivirga sp. 4D4 TaxID=1889784 RepID=UPI000853106A|nr:hypothetical protein [Roseivirga sp. 4D4]OEK00605.1 hypothetical protein BFP97_03390 [Roseivirga sp. 4D4]
MKKHRQIFDKIKELLSEQFGSDLNEYEEGAYLSIGESEIWISVDDSELTVGYGMNHKHYHYEYDDINEAVDKFFNLLTKKKRITEFYKGKYTYKNIAEIENSNGEFKELSTSLTWLFPYWRKTRSKTEIEPSLIDYSKIEKEILQIKNYAQQ